MNVWTTITAKTAKFIRIISLFWSQIHSRCLLCNAEGQQSSPLCRGCRSDLPYLHNPCWQCGLPLGHSNTTTPEVNVICGECLQNPPPFTQTVAPLCYSGPVAYLLRRYKFDHQLMAGHALISAVLPVFAASQQPALLIPVPMHWRRWLWRGGNHTDWLAHTLGKQLNIPVDHHASQRVRATPSQRQLKRQARLHNLEQAFSVNPRVKGLHIALIDDVMTTGATAWQLAQCALLQGADRVDIWVLARTPFPTA